MSYKFLLDIALILLSTKIFGLIAKRYRMPQVVGALIAGVLLGPAVFNIIQGTEFLTMVAELGVIVIMFTAGMETDIRELKKSGTSGFLVALIGVLVPIILGAGLMFFYNTGDFAFDGNVILRNIFIGIVLTATSVSITVEALKEMGKLNTKVGNTILAAAIIDDVLGLVALTVITAIAGAEVNIYFVLLKIVLFFVFSLIVGFGMYHGFKWYAKKVNDQDLHRFPIIAFVICLIMSYMAEHFFGIADIIGAFVAGLVVANTSKAHYIASKFSPLSYLLLSPIFFASIGFKMVIPEMNWQSIIFTILLILIAIISKLIGCGLGAKLTGYSIRESAQVGIGMVCRGEVALIVINKGYSLGLINPTLFGPIVIMVIVTTLITPVLLKVVFVNDQSKVENSELIDSFETIEQIDRLEQKLLGQE